MPATPLKSYLVDIVDTNGVLVPSPTITVRDVGTLNTATIYQDEFALKGVASNPQSVNPFRFFAEAGTVDLLVVKDAYQYRPRNITPHIHGQHILVIELENVTPGSFTVGGNLVVSGTGPHAIGGASVDRWQLLLTGSFAQGAATGQAGALVITSAISPDPNEDASGLIIAPTIIEAASGTHATFAGAKFQAPTITAGAADLTNAATVYIFNAPSGATNNYSLWVDVGVSRFDGIVQLNPNLNIRPTSFSGGAVLENLNAAGLHFWLDAAAAGDFLWKVGTDPSAVGGTELMRLTDTGSWTLATAGPHAIGGATNNQSQIRVLGSFTQGGGTVIRGIRYESTLNPLDNSSAFAVDIQPTIVETAAGTHPDFVSLQIQPSTITSDAAALTNASTVKITAAPTGATNNYALWVAAGAIRWPLGGGSQEMSVGAVDSGGAGFRVLRVPN